MRFRQVHLDFHTSEKIEGVGSRFDKKQFQAALKAGHVNSVTVFSKCHHGWSYHPTDVNAMHPHLAFDLLGAQIEAAHEIGVNAVVYLSAGYDEKYITAHPEDRFVTKKEYLSPAPAGPETPKFHRICLASPRYLAELAAEVREVCERYPADGIFMDIVSIKPCYCPRCLAAMRAEGLDPDNDADAARYGEEVHCRYAETINAAAHAVKPDMHVFHNDGAHFPRGKRNLRKLNSHTEIESLPTGGWGYDHLPLAARYAQTLGEDYLGMTGKFHCGWGEFGGYKHPNALRYETALAVANGGKCSVGDQLHPLGEMDAETYRLIGEAYADIEALEPWLDGVRSVADIALLSGEAWFAANPEAAARDTYDKNADVGALRILTEGHFLFDVVDTECDLSKYRVVILPDRVRPDAALAAGLRAFLAAGGKLLASGSAGLALDKDEFLFDFGAAYVGKRPFAPIYFIPEKPLDGMGKAGYVIYAPAHRAELAAGGELLAAAHDPYFERTPEHFCSHRHAPERFEPAGVAATLGKDGAYIAAEIFAEYAAVGSRFAKELVIAALNACLGKPAAAVKLPAGGVFTVMDQPAEQRLVAHLLYAPRVTKGAQKIEVIEDAVPLYNVPLTYGNITNKLRIKRVYTAPDGAELPFAVLPDGDVSVTVPRVEIHAMVVADYEET